MLDSIRHSHRPLCRRTIGAATLAAIALGVAACGGADEDEPAGGGPATTPASAQREGGGGDRSAPVKRAKRPAGDAPALLGDRTEARTGAVAVTNLYRDLRAAVRTGVAAADVGVLDTLDEAGEADSLSKVCGLMSEQARRQTIEYADRSAGLADVDWTCEKATGLLLRRAGQRGNLQRATRVTVVGVNADGDRATATVRFGGRKRPLATIPLVKEDGKWKLGATPGQG